MQAKRILKWTVAAIAVLILALGIGLFTVDLGFLRPNIEKRLTLMTGRAVSIGSGLSIKLGRELVIHADDLRLANAPWAGEGELARIQNAHLVVDTRSLLSGPVVLKQLSADGVTLLLIQNEAGQSNWVFTEAAAAPVDEGALPFLLEAFNLRNAHIEFRSPRLDQPLVAQITELQESVGPQGMIESHLTGQLNGKAVEFNGTAGPYERLVSGDDFELSGAGRFGNIQLNGTAVLDNLYLPQRPTVEISLEGPDLEELTSMLGIEGLGKGPISLLTTTTASEDGLAANLKGTLGQFKVDINGNAHSLQAFGDARVDARVSARRARTGGRRGYRRARADRVCRIRPRAGRSPRRARRVSASRSCSMRRRSCGDPPPPTPVP